MASKFSSVLYNMEYYARGLYRSWKLALEMSMSNVNVKRSLEDLQYEEDAFRLAGLSVA
jgi:hypothetical protein